MKCTMSTSFEIGNKPLPRGMLNLMRNLYDLTESCELFSMLNPEDTTEIRRQMTDWISSDRNFTNKAYPYVCKLISVLSKVGK